ncbi:MAG: hypothetical protein KJ914_13370 [Gammaproteobacteria bacterium]|nr:hypothetical protein [Gammaproteobacteria bacterium]MBU1725427.1 hypothetical protein [Gammaproteobacteria bacterium]MBU2005297.1 hypothetical protein [Gammaproteobacteria bacterium]
MKQHDTTPTQSFKLKAINILISLVIVFLTAANGIFTYSGAYLYLEEHLYAILFAAAVQFAIAISLLALPYVHGIGKISLGLVYAAALLLSTLSAYTYIYNSSLPGKNTVYSVDTGLKAVITTTLSDVLAGEQKFLRESESQVAENKRLMDEEGRNGGRSGLGPGKGPEYYRKVDAYQQSASHLETHQSNFAALREQLNLINQQLAASSDDVVRDGLLVEIAKMRAVTNADSSREALTGMIKNDLGSLQNPVEKAMATLMEPPAGYSIQVIVGIIWAGVFDLVALFLGIVRYYILSPGKPFFQSVYDGLLNTALFFMRLFHLRKEAAFQFSKAPGYQQHKHEIPLNSPEMQTFATRLLVGSQMATDDDEDPAEPLHTLIGHIQPLHLEGEEQQVGIPFETVESEPRLKTLLAMLIQSEVLLYRREAACYVLNPAEGMAQKVMIFIRMGMRNSPDSLLAPAAFLLGPDQRQTALP